MLHSLSDPQSRNSSARQFTPHLGHPSTPWTFCLGVPLVRGWAGNPLLLALYKGISHIGSGVTGVAILGKYPALLHKLSVRVLPQILV
mmetsp:Transcript_39280/g.61228  ORF Transcript_39280/g.61228 Transcript_39280/m.61228 type:complete len:88 (-) Transcript_39280:152-415(-)